MAKKLTIKDLIDFEKDIKQIYEKGAIKAPIHLSGNNERQLIKIFKKINSGDWVFSTWRNPKFVNRITGAIENIMIAMTPGVIPIPNNITTGIK